MSAVFREILELLETGEDAVLVTIVDAHGSVPARVGDKMLVVSEGIKGTVGGGLEKLLMEKAQTLRCRLRCRLLRRSRRFPREKPAFLTAATACHGRSRQAQ